jgi:hypothetical protein
VNVEPQLLQAIADDQALGVSERKWELLPAAITRGRRCAAHRRTVRSRSKPVTRRIRAPQQGLLR